MCVLDERSDAKPVVPPPGTILIAACFDAVFCLDGTFFVCRPKII